MFGTRAWPENAMFLLVKDNPTLNRVSTEQGPRISVDDTYVNNVTSFHNQVIADKWRYMATQIWFNIGLGNGVLTDVTKPSPEPMLTYHQIFFQHLVSALDIQNGDAMHNGGRALFALFWKENVKFAKFS